MSKVGQIISLLDKINYYYNNIDNLKEKTEKFSFEYNICYELQSILILIKDILELENNDLLQSGNETKNK